MPIPLRVIYTSLTLLLVSAVSATTAIAKPLVEVNPSQPQLIAQTPVEETPEDFEVQPSLSPEQTDQIKAVFAAYNPKLQSAFSEYQNSLQAFEDIIGTNPPNEEIQTRRSDVLDKERIVADLLFERTMAVRDVLTDEQKASIAEYMREQIEQD